MDVDEMLAEMTPEMFDEWIAANEINPLGDEKICWVLALVGVAIVSRLNLACKWMGAKDIPEIQAKDFIPWLKKPKKKKEKYVNPNQAAAMFKMAVNNGDHR